jgi:GAF domain-containing protein
MATTDTGFPFKRVFNLKKLIEFWEDATRDESKILAAHASHLHDELEQHPDLLEEELEPEVLNRHPDLVSYLLTPLIPLGGSAKRYATVIPPFKLEPVYSTEAFSELGFEDGCEDNFRISGIPMSAEYFNTGKVVNAYHEILGRLTGERGDWALPFVFTTNSDSAGRRRHFKIEFDTRFVDLKINGKAPELGPDDLTRLADDPMNLSLWTELLPPELFEFHGFVVINAAEVTIPEELSLLKDDLLATGSMSSPEHFDKLESSLRTILDRPDVQLGLLAMERSESGDITGARPVGRSLLMHDKKLPDCQDKSQSFYVRAFKSDEPIIVRDLETCKEACTGFEHRLITTGYRNLVIAPLHFEGQLVGILELASPNANDVNNWNIGRLMQVRSLFASAIHYDQEQREDRLQSVIKRQYTAIHPSVEWRFRDAAQRYIEALSTDARAEVEDVVFEGVYPLYGLSDIRGSSTHRVEAIQADLVSQLELALDVVKAAKEARPLPALDELGFRIENHIRHIKSGLSSGDEVSVLEFLKFEQENRLDHFAAYSEDTRRAVEAYREALDPVLGVVYRLRRDFDQSIQMINDRIAAYLEKEQESAQEMYPHYFERYLTDGVDYNIYLGASMAPGRPFDPIYLRNLRLWQLMMTCGIEWEMRALRPDLPMALETAHLILVQSASLSVRFRDDEKKFDVDGAYNARYEIVKKRIDKATIQGTGERLTEPGSIAVVYSQAKEGSEYRRYFEYLRASGHLAGEVEDVVLEDLPGVSGLRAFKVQVAKASPDTSFEVTPTGEVEPVRAS